MACRKRPAAALPCLLRIDDVRAHVDPVRQITADFPDWGYKRVGARLGERLGVTLEPSDLQVVRRIMLELSEGRSAVGELEWEAFAGDMRDHVDAIRALLVVHSGMGYMGIAKELAQHLRVKLCPAHVSVVRRIVDGISEGRAVPPYNFSLCA